MMLSKFQFRLALICFAIIIAYTYLLGFSRLLGITIWRAPNPPVDLYTYFQEIRDLFTTGETQGIFPPFSFLAIALFVWPPKDLLAPYFAIINLLSFFVIAYWCWIRTVGLQNRECIFLLFACLACPSYAFMLGQGQFAAILLALLSIFLIKDSRHENSQLSRMAMGLILAIAIAKPHASFFFIVPLLVKKRYFEIVVAALITLASTFYFSSIAGLSPLEFFYFNSQVWIKHAPLGVGPLALFIHLGFEQSWALLSVAFFFSSLGLLLIWRCRHASLARLFAIAGIISRLWTYHHAYDDCLLTFAVLELGLDAMRHRRYSDWAWFIMVGLTFWFPTDLLFHLFPDKSAESFFVFNLFQSVTWTAAAVKLSFASMSKEISK